jgi:branched-chain amino acid aminotransferase
MARADVWYDGSFVGWEDARVSVLSHGIQRGALVFDVGPMRAGAGGAAFLFRPREHIARFLRSAELVGLQVRWDPDALLEATLATARRSLARGTASALVRWSAFVPSLEPDVVPRAGSPAAACIAVIAPEDAVAPGEPVPRKPEFVRLSVPRDVRKAGPDVFPTQAKVAASYLGPMLAKRRALQAGFDEVVLLDGDGRLAEAPTANVFIVARGCLTTPPLERVLAGITRDSVLAWARAEGIEVREEHVRPEQLADADEAFLTASSLPVQPIASCDGRPLQAGCPGPMASRVKAALQACERGEDPRFEAWAVRV